MTDKYLVSFTVPSKKFGTIGIAPDGAKVKFVDPKWIPPHWTVVEAMLLAKKQQLEANWTQHKLDLVGDVPESAARLMRMGALFDPRTPNRRVLGNFVSGLDQARREWTRIGHEYTELDFQWGGDSRWKFTWERHGERDNFRDLVESWGRKDTRGWWNP